MCSKGGELTSILCDEHLRLPTLIAYAPSLAVHCRWSFRATGIRYADVYHPVLRCCHVYELRMAGVDRNLRSNPRYWATKILQDCVEGAGSPEMRQTIPPSVEVQRSLARRCPSCRACERRTWFACMFVEQARCGCFFFMSTFPEVYTRLPFLALSTAPPPTWCMNSTRVAP